MKLLITYCWIIGNAAFGYWRQGPAGAVLWLAICFAALCAWQAVQARWQRKPVALSTWHGAMIVLTPWRYRWCCRCGCWHSKAGGANQ